MLAFLNLVADIGDVAFVVALLLSTAAFLMPRMRRASSLALKICAGVWLFQVWLNCSALVIVQWPRMGFLLAVPLVAFLLPVTIVLLLLQKSWMVLFGIVSTLALCAGERSLAGYFDDHPYRALERSGEDPSSSVSSAAG